MSEKPQAKSSLMAMELEVEAEGREWMRQRLEQKLQAQADWEGLVFPYEQLAGAGNNGKHQWHLAICRYRRDELCPSVLSRPASVLKNRLNVKTEDERERRYEFRGKRLGTVSEI